MIKSKGLFTTEGMTSSDRSLHTPGDFARQNLLYVQEVGRLKSLKPHRCIREKLESYLFIVVLRGRGKLVVNEHSYDLHAGDCALVDCWEHYEHISDENDGWELAWVHYYGNTARSFYELFRKGNGGSSVFRVEDTERWNHPLSDPLGPFLPIFFRAHALFLPEHPPHCGLIAYTRFGGYLFRIPGGRYRAVESIDRPVAAAARRSEYAGRIAVRRAVAAATVQDIAESFRLRHSGGRAGETAGFLPEHPPHCGLIAYTRFGGYLSHRFDTEPQQFFGSV